ncbi:hypothetical protein [Glaciimonas immobilis]|uniref:Uncharacterized protein n=1 Tax=Glaciimonas immobilis TaxID=728004 RepID=A0A840RRR7_9BURK|nr:hypothetical protein [Glaciimonas immobilis]KAF3997932.1 hypothetical protein HAV38_10180 [Glaciimonas immobilis]MBB5199404.1 hypothetical protein [Glaciimonas immobilis]
MAELPQDITENFLIYFLKSKTQRIEPEFVKTLLTFKLPNGRLVVATGIVPTDMKIVINRMHFYRSSRVCQRRNM